MLTAMGDGVVRASALTWPVLSVALLAACTSSPEASPTGSRTSESASARPEVELGCADAGNGSAVASGTSLSVGGLTLEDVARPLAGVPRAGDLGFRMPDGSAEQRLRKTPADVAAGTGPVTVELIDPADGEALMWVPADQWSSSLDAGRWMTAKVTFDGCPDRDVTYFGGLLAPAPGRCLHLRIRPAGAAAQDHRQRLDGRPC